MTHKDYRILLYYKYVTIEDPIAFAEEHLALCQDLGLLGRILVGNEGINGTVSGTIEQTDAYMNHMKEDPRFSDIMWKIDEADGHAFKKMHVRPRREIVHLGLENDINPLELTGEYLSPKEFMEQMQEENTIIIDARNDYEFDLGHFRGAIRPDIENFRDLPAWMETHKEEFVDKKILTYCTGGIRCEKFSGWLKREGYGKSVGQLHGGIATYAKDSEVKGQLWDGQMFVFDRRRSVPINQVEHVVIGKDYFTGEPSERYTNCANPECHKLMLCEEKHEDFYMRSCSDECRRAKRNFFVEEHGWTVNQIEDQIAKILDVQNANS
ncbi:rhodanese-related sulfurtransferase [Lysinibacillus fusiformis]|uniref:oxygen-dependent tRNA uridine(34) hydroxylase TrhO n=1 Tax=Lysinibacillus TaxID=400634 RepID=UPI0004D77C44|nr:MULTISPECIES: rhodanese-related sulfurtransferase [Lysinibacillus]AJK86466.1 sulfurtransferase [Lysinibacillus fusiformis]KAB0445072.1 rhodanese domain-containing protein [Lysinibacillus fusiformis]KGA83381.1 sulfurtransferase [Lysinibacillus fusiformis]KHK56439.1 sulfurtransferase [Lysinibacillus sp. A1]MCE4045257.1 rhodanese-related sulfurtransferase [Lysinibacillus fusiformis]